MRWKSVFYIEYLFEIEIQSQTKKEIHPSAFKADVIQKTGQNSPELCVFKSFFRHINLLNMESNRGEEQND
jgi:hypothetical protein